jgi:dienelactone hydrolase
VGGHSGAGGGEGGAGGEGASGDGGAGSGGGGAVTGPTLPAIDDPGGAGPFGVDRVETVSGLSSHSLFVPDAVGSHGKHPVVVWTCGNGGTVSFYASFLDHLASHGFLVVADKASSSDREAEVASQSAAIDWLLAADAMQGGDFFGKIDRDNIAVMGHSLGSLASFATAAQNEHVATSVHFSGGLTGNPVGFDESWLADMTKPAAFLCGGADSTAGPACADDFESAPPALPVFYGVLAGASHIGPFGGTPRAGQYGRAGVAWLRWQLAEDPAFAPWFVGTGCTLCSSPWTAQQRNLQ